MHRIGSLWLCSGVFTPDNEVISVSAVLTVTTQHPYMILSAPLWSCPVLSSVCTHSLIPLNLLQNGSLLWHLCQLKKAFAL